ncbi:MAG: tetratricopeptide repeat protein [Kaistella sp.]|nr:tetratricopeptide repeat protein [Kaistella sp.]
MKLHFTLLFLALSVVTGQINSQTFKTRFAKLVSENDTVGQVKLLESWEKTDRNDPELFIAYYNYYVNKAGKEVITLGQNPKGDDVLALMDQDKTKKEPVAYMYGDIQYDPDLLSKGFSWINRGIEKHPDRLDMRFGKIYLLGQIGDYENFTTEIIRAVDHSVVNDNKWKWDDSKPYEQTSKYFLSNIQTYVIHLYNTGDDALLDNMKRIAEAVLKNYPDHIESLSNLSIVYMVQKQYSKAFEPLLKAHRLNPEDFIVLSNLGQAYKLTGDKNNAIKYYELTVKYGDEQAKRFAKEQIKEIKGK